MKLTVANQRFFLLFILLALGFSVPQRVQADFTLSPAKIELTMKLGETSQRFLTLTNRESSPKRAVITFEDFAPEASAYSLIPYLATSPRVIDVPAGGSIQIPITVELPTTAPVGSFHGAVFFSFLPLEPLPTDGVITTSRLGALFFIQLADGRAAASGRLNKFGLLDQRWFRAGESIIFYSNYTNSGNVYLNPYGLISLTNRLTQAKLVQTIDPWFVLPESSRTREITLARGLSFGWYEARLELNRGYADIVDEKTISFFVWSRPFVGSLIAILIILIATTWFIIKKLKK